MAGFIIWEIELSIQFCHFISLQTSSMVWKITIYNLHDISQNWLVDKVGLRVEKYFANTENNCVAEKIFQSVHWVDIFHQRAVTGLVVPQYSLAGRVS